MNRLLKYDDCLVMAKDILSGEKFITIRKFLEIIECIDGNLFSFLNDGFKMKILTMKN